jgi:hypothetical protein
VFYPHLHEEPFILTRPLPHAWVPAEAKGDNHEVVFTKGVQSGWSWHLQTPGLVCAESCSAQPEAEVLKPNVRAWGSFKEARSCSPYTEWLKVHVWSHATWFESQLNCWWFVIPHGELVLPSTRLLTCHMGDTAGA